MFRKQVPVILVAALWAAAPCLAQDSVSKTGCLPGDAVNPWADASAAMGSEQCDNYVVDMAPLTTSWGNQFGIAPIIKSSKSGAGFFGSLVSAQSISREQWTYQRLRPGLYWEWSDAGYGVNNDPAISTQGTPIATAALTGHQFGVIFSEYATTDPAKNYNGIVGGMVHIRPAAPARLYVQRIMAAINSCDNNSNLSTFGIGTVDAKGYIHLRTDGFGGSANACGLTAFAAALDDNIFQLNMADRDCDIRNVISNNFLGANQFDMGATKQWLVRNNATRYNTPGTMPSQVTGGAAKLLGTNFDKEYVRGSTLPVTEDTSHWAGPVPPALPGITDHRGGLSYMSHNFPYFDATNGVAAVLGQRVYTDSIILFGLDANANANVTGNLALTLPANPARITDNDDLFMNMVDPALPNAFNNYRSQVATLGGNAQVSMNVVPDATAPNGQVMLVAAQVDHPFNLSTLNWDVNYIAVAKIRCVDVACNAVTVTWTMAGYNFTDPLVSGGPMGGKSILNGLAGPGNPGTSIGRMIPVTGDQTIRGGPSVSSPMVDAGGNVWFVSRIELDANPGVPTYGLLRAVYQPASFSYELELVYTFLDQFQGQNSNRPYMITYVPLEDSNSISSSAPFSQNVSQLAHLGMNPALLTTPGDPRGLGGLVMTAEIIYDVDEDGEFNECSGTFGDPSSADQNYNVLLYLGSLAPAVPQTCSPQPPDTHPPGNCDDNNVCTDDECNAGICNFVPKRYGDINGNGFITLADLFCVLNGFAGDFTNCSFEEDDIQGSCGAGLPACCPNGAIALGDLFAVLNAFSGVDPCCTGPKGACCLDGVCNGGQTEVACLAADGIYLGDGSDCATGQCPPVGACCILDAVHPQCIPTRTVEQCAALGGEYLGNGTVCEPNTCPLVGACCVQGICHDNTKQVNCQPPNIYQGNGTTCDVVTCPTGACCAAGYCDVVAQADCIAAGGVYQGNSTPCPDCGPDVIVKINEIRIAETGAENDEYFELKGTAGTSLNGLTYLVIGDGPGGTGVIEAVVPLSGKSIPGDGYFLAAESTFTFAPPDLVTVLNFENSDNVTHMLVAGFVGHLLQDLDTNDDCVLDVTPWFSVLDSVAVIGLDVPPVGDCVYSLTTVGPDGIYVPGHVYLSSNALPWVIGPIGFPGFDTPGTANLP